jgi:S-adenosylmethionine synthetase
MWKIWISQYIAKGQIVLTNKSIKNDFKGSNVIKGIEVVFKGRPFTDNFSSITLSNKSIKNDTTFIRALTSC